MPDDQVKPRMSRKARWLTAAVVVLFVTPFLAHGVWTLVAANRVARQVEALQAAGEPILPADFAPVNYDRGDNAVPDIIAAGQAFDRTDPLIADFLDLSPRLPLTAKERDLIDQVLTLHGAALNHLESARTKPRAVWSPNLTSPVLINAMLPSLNEYRDLTNLLSATALLDHESGDDASAVMRIDRTLFLGRVVGEYPSVVNHLVHVAISAVAADRATEIAPEMRVGGDSGARPEQVGALVGQFLDDAPARASYARGMRGERMAQLDAIRSLTGGMAVATPGGTARQWNPLARYFLRPFADRNAALALDYMAGVIPLADEPNWPAAQSKIPAAPPRSAMNTLVAMLAPSFERAVRTHFQAATDRRLAAIALAVGWYAAEHDGRRPARLEDLVPRYLPEVPIDPMSPSGTPLQYLPRADDPVVYSVGVDGVDDGGSEVPAKPGDPNPNEWTRKDRVVPLTRRPRPEPEKESDGVGDLPAEQLAPATQSQLVE